MEELLFILFDVGGSAPLWTGHAGVPGLGESE